MIWSDLLVWVSSVSSFIGSVSGFITGADIWPNPSRSSRNLVEFVKIWPRFHRTTQDITGSRRIWTRSRQDFAEFGLECLINRLKGRSSFTCFKRGNPKPTCRGQVREVGTRVRPPELLDQVAAGQTCAGWPGWAGRLDTPM